MTGNMHLTKAVYSDLETLTHFWCFKRKSIAATIAQALEDFEKKVDERFTEQQLNHQRQRFQQGTEHDLQIAHLKNQHQQAISQQKQVLTTQISALETQRSELSTRNTDLADKVASLDEAITTTQMLLSQKHADMQVLEGLKNQLDESHQQLQNDYSQLHEDNLTLHERFTLIQSVLSAQPAENEGIDAFRRLLYTDYAAFAAEESSLADEAGALLDLQNILNELVYLNTFPAASGKTVVGVAGGFSSGKSEFINSFILDKSIKLATGLNPVTVIPSFVVCAPTSRISGAANNGGSIRLSSKIYKALSHEYLSSFGFDLRKIMPLISLQVPMNEALFEHLCLVDTPGYNPGTMNISEQADRNTSAKFLEQCTVMIWVIGLDPAGTISQSDIDFIRQQSFTAKNLYIVLNKADVKSQEDIQSIMAEVADSLMFAGIEYAGITAYSSIRSSSYGFEKCSLEEFLKEKNKRYNITSGYEDKIQNVFNRYEIALQKDIDNLQLLRAKIKDLQLKTLVDVGARAVKDLQDISGFLSQQLGSEDEIKSQLAVSSQLCLSLREATRQAILVMQRQSQTH